MKVAIIGAGKVGRSLARALRQTAHTVDLIPARSGVPRRRIVAALLVLAVRDGQLAGWARDLARARVVARRAAVVHLAGALGVEVLSPLRGAVAGLGRAHPAVSFASSSVSPWLVGASLVVSGDEIAVKRASRVGRAIGLVPRSGDAIDPIAYHAACALVANGGAAIAASAHRLLVHAGLSASDSTGVVGPLLRSVGQNVAQLGLPGALSGPIRRGDSVTLRKHLGKVREQAPELIFLYVELAKVQLAMARELAEASPEQLAAVERVLRRRRRDEAPAAPNPPHSELPAGPDRESVSVRAQRLAK